ncbi:MAG: hypothetical protein IJ157_07670 [Clostridia bacterium]|nr:hypothetical protein [Clostridia bacterium]
MEASILNAFYSPAQLIRWRQAMPGRYSCRAYAGPPDADQLTALHYAAQRVCLPGVRIIIADCPEGLFLRIPLVEPIRGATVYACVVADLEQTLPHTLAGISGEAFVLEAAAMKVNTCWVSGTYRRSAVNVKIRENERVVAVTPLGIAAGEPPQGRKRKKLAQICTSAPENWPQWAYQAAECVRQAPSAVNMQPWSLSYGQKTLRLLGKKADSLDMGIAMLHMAAAMGGKRYHWEWGQQKCVAHLIAEDNA